MSIIELFVASDVNLRSIVDQPSPASRAAHEMLLDKQLALQIFFSLCV